MQNSIFTNDGGLHGGRKTLTLQIEGKEYEWNEQFITGLQLKTLAGLSPDTPLYRNVAETYQDEQIENLTRVNLAAEGVEEFFVRRPQKFVIEGKEYQTIKQFMQGAELRRLGRIPPDQDLFQLMEQPWEDVLIADNDWLDFALPGIEHYAARTKGEGVLVEITINGKPFKLKRGKYTVSALKKIGGVPAQDELNQLVDGRLKPLDNNDTVLIKGCEQFISCKPDGASS